MAIQKKAGDSYGVDIAFEHKGKGEQIRFRMQLWTQFGLLIATLTSDWKSLADAADWKPQSLSARGAFPTRPQDGELFNADIWVEGSVSGGIWYSDLLLVIYQNVVPITAPQYKAFTYSFV